MTRGAIATPHPLATAAGLAILREGGSAVDAAVAASAVLCVVAPHLTSIAGDLWALVWPAGAGGPEGYVGTGRTAAAGGLVAPLRGPAAVTTPGTVEAWGRLLERHGSFGLGPLIDPAVRAAGEGFVIGAGLGRALAESATRLLQADQARPLLPPLKAGMLLRNPDLAATLGEIGRFGTGGFYRGATGDRLVAGLRAAGSAIGSGDLWLPRGRWVAPEAEAMGELDAHRLPAPAPAAAELRGVHVCAADLQGVLVALAQGGGVEAFGSALVAPGSGVLFQDRGAAFSPGPVPAGAQPPGALVPVLLGRGRRPLGACADDPALEGQVLARLVAGLDPVAAVAAPRRRIAPGGGSTWIEADHPEARGGGRPMPAADSRFGQSQALVVDGPGRWRVAADPRFEGLAGDC